MFQLDCVGSVNDVPFKSYQVLSLPGVTHSLVVGYCNRIKKARVDVFHSLVVSYEGIKRYLLLFVVYFQLNTFVILFLVNTDKTLKLKPLMFCLGFSCLSGAE